MEIAILVFFLAIFGGVLFLLALVWFIFRRVEGSRSSNRNFAGGASYGEHSGTRHDSIDSDDNNDAALFAGSALFANQDSENQNPENQVHTEIAQDAATQSENTYSHESHGSGAAPAEPSYSSYDSGSSYDSSSSSDSGSSSSDSGGSSSSSSD